MENDRWDAAIAYAYECLEIYKATPNGGFAAVLIAQDIASYENGTRSDELLDALENIAL